MPYLSVLFTDNQAFNKNLNTCEITMMSLTSTYPVMKDAGFPPEPQWKEHEHSKQNETFFSSTTPQTNFHNLTDSFDPLGGHAIWQVVGIVLLTGSLSLVTVVGNILVLVSFRINKALKTVNNYYLLSLAFADLTIGTLSMNLYTTYIIMDTWALGNWACDLWLAIDYVASNASVMNLLVISFDRYFSVTKPLTYRAKRTTKRAMIMICSAWTISFVLWAPAILFWQFIIGERTVPSGECYIQFLSEPIITFCTAIAAFYLPVTIMAILFWKIYKETENRSKDLVSLKGSGNQSKHEVCTSRPLIEIPKSNSSTDCNLPAQNSSGKMSWAWRWSSSSRYEEKAVNRNEPENNSADEKCSNNIGACVNLLQSDIESTTERQTSKMDFKSTSLSVTVKDAAMAKRFAYKARMSINKRKKQSVVKEKKAAQTLSAILLAFIITWTPYNIMVLVNTFCNDCIPEALWALGYWLCYVNSTINPMCYALCNKNFRNTFKMILFCQWKVKQNKLQFQPKQRQASAFRKKEPL
ncbi:hypothetical protein ACEWY4_025617 [Coilia grayii]|uniref:Muscarinic acetylcholine receptor n=1 Tax=Coilia grayii TaxID=363190 RepID=A0ABD1ISF3_9TELE